MSDETSLERAHSLSAHASVLLAPGHVTAQTLSLALKAYTDAADLFEQASTKVDDTSAKRTLVLLVNQHRKLAKDLERKLDRGEGSSRQEEVVRGTVRRSQTTPVPTRDGPSLGLGSIGREVWPPPGIATRVSPARGLPPFALRPVPAAREYMSNTAQDQLSPLHSSSSSSGTETGTGGSYYNFGAIPDTLDPFSRFWGKLDNMLDDISNPVAFATASVNAPASAGEVEGDRRERRRTSERKKDKEREQGTRRAESPGSFYLVNGHTLPKVDGSTRTSSPTEKTPEELILENENLRTSLDAIASHAQAVDEENKRLKMDAEERSKLMKSAILEVKRELLGSIPSPNPRRLDASRYTPSVPPSDLVTNQRKRIETLEEELSLLKVENEKNKDAAARYKERIDKIKANAKSKKEAKMRGEELSRS